jgi:hypothetical protein
MIVLRIAVFLIGLAVVGNTLMSAIRTVVLPRAQQVRITRFIFAGLRIIFDWLARPSRPFDERDRIMAVYGPIALLVLLVAWVVLILLGYSLMFAGLGLTPFDAFTESGSSLLTLGIRPPVGLGALVLAFSEATIGLGIIALLISYLPSIYGAFTRRETAVSLLETYAGSPPSPRDYLLRHHLIHGLEFLDDTWIRWQTWFADVEESHTSIAAVCFFRSPQPEQSWITAAGCVLDAAALTASTLDIEREPRAELCLRAGYVSLRRIADFFGIPHNADPSPEDPISITRREYDDAVDHLAAAGLPIKADREQAWRDFRGWRVNYDTVLLALVALTMAPPAEWSSDRAPSWEHTPLTRWGRRR